MIQINSTNYGELSFRQQLLYVAVPVFVFWIGANSVSLLIRGADITLTGFTVAVFAQAVAAGMVAALTLDGIQTIRPNWMKSKWMVAGGVAAVISVITVLTNVWVPGSLVEHVVALVGNTLGTGGATVIGLSVYQGRSAPNFVQQQNGGADGD